MKVITVEENLLEFDNGLRIVGDGDVDCCAYNYLDFEQFEVGQEFPTMTANAFAKNIKLKEDGFAMKTTDGTPKWCQARSDQNGYYSNITTIHAVYKGKGVNMGELGGDIV